MEIKIGIQHAARDLIVDSAESTDDLAKLVSEAVGRDGVLTLTDNRGRKVIVPAAKLAYVEIGPGVTGQVGFRS